MGFKSVVPKDFHYSNFQFVKDLWNFYSEQKGKFILFSIMLALVSVIGLMPPIIVSKMINLLSSDAKTFSSFYLLLALLVGIQITATILRLRSKFHLGLIGSKSEQIARVSSFQRMLQCDLFWHDKENTGNKMEKINGGVQAIARFTNFYLNQGINIVITLVGVLAVFTFFSWKYSILALSFMVLYLYVEFKFNKRIAKETMQVRKVKEQSSGKAYEFSANITTIKSMGLESPSRNKIRNIEQKLFEAVKAKSNLSNTKWICVQLIAVVFYGIFVFLVGRDVLIGLLTVGSIVIYIDYVGKLQNILNIISNQALALIDIKYGMFRMMEVYRTMPEINEKGAKNISGWKSISMEDLSFKYKDEGILEKFNLEIKKGEKIGIVGRSGSGKSTLFKLLLKLYLPKKGMIYFDGKPITQIKRNSILSKISVVPQETELFNLTLRENITISRAGKFDAKRYERAIKVSQLDKVIAKLKHKDLSFIGEKGIRLSGGERQRLGIARAIYKGSDIIIFDESTSNLDYATEKKIQERIDSLEGKTLIVAAHRLSTLKEMDKIVVMKSGKIIEEGSYPELIEKKGEFYKIWKKQERKK